MLLALAVACVNFDAVVQQNQFDPEWDPEGEAVQTVPVQTLWLQQDVSLTLNLLQTPLHSGPKWS